MQSTSTAFLAATTSLLLAIVACSLLIAQSNSRPIDRDIALQRLTVDYPNVRFYRQNDRVTRIYGCAFGSGNSPEDAAEGFRMDYVQLLGVDSEDLIASSRLADERHTQPVMYDRISDDYKFTLVYYTQQRDEIPVFRSELRLLVRNEPGYPIVLAASSLKDLGDFRPYGRAALDVFAAESTVRADEPGLTEFSEPELVIWAGSALEPANPRLAYTITGSSDDPENWLFVVDAISGQIVVKEDQICRIAISGNVSALATEGTAADYCSPEIPTPLPYSKVACNTHFTYADSQGNFLLVTTEQLPLDIESHVSGKFFNIETAMGDNCYIIDEVESTDPVQFLHNPDTTDEYTNAQVNAYVHANKARDFTLAYNPSYPVIESETGFYIFVNEGGETAYYSDGTIHCGRSVRGHCNMAFSTVIHHEYGHHLVAVSGNQQDQYGEGIADGLAVAITDEPWLAKGAFWDCNGNMRNADNMRKYPCYSEDPHDCGKLLSGCVWSTRDELIVTDPDYQDILANLLINSILIHTPNSQITPAVYFDWLTLDDDDGNLENGTPHFTEIFDGFNEHCMVPAEVTSMSPTQNQIDFAASADISASFNIDMNASTFTSPSMVAHARSGGLHEVTFAYDAGTRTCTMNPVADFLPSEIVAVVITNGVQAACGTGVTPHVWSFTTGAQAVPADFSAASNFSIGGSSRSVIAADLNGDGYPDLAATTHNTDEVAVLLNRGDGTFRRYDDYRVHDSPASLTAFDLENDGDLDIAVTSETSTNVSVLENLGNGNFETYTSHAAQGPTNAIFAGDFDADGFLDLAATKTAPGTITVLLNQGDGSFVLTNTHGAADYHGCLFSADIDEDGILDLVTTDGNNDEVSISYGSGGGIFSWITPTVIDVGDDPQSVAAADLDGDGYLDIVTANRGSGDVSVVLNQGDGTFSNAVAYSVNSQPLSVFAADFNGDGSIDLATTNSGSDDLTVLLNEGDGAFAFHADYDLGDAPSCIFAVDLDCDRDADLAAVHQNASYASVLINSATCVDVDADGYGDPGHAENDCPDDNCPDIYNPDQADSNGNGIGDVCDCVPGDADHTGQVDIDDFTYLMDHVFCGGPPPIPMMCCGDADGSDKIDIDDITYLITYIFVEGPEPVTDACADEWGAD